MIKKISKKSIYLYTLPIILSELLEEAMILSDSILLSFKDPLYLSTVGIIDSIFLLFLAIGASMNDSFQNFYSRHSRDYARCKGIFTHSLLLFFGVSLVFALLCSLIPLSRFLFESVHLNVLISVAPYLAILIVLSFVSMALNSLLMGWGYTKYLGLISLTSVIANITLGYLLLYVYDIGLNPCAIVLVTSSLAELIAIVFMFLKIYKIYRNNRIIECKTHHQSLILETLVYASAFPCISDICFHLGSLALYTYCLCYLTDSEAALFTLFMAYWGVLQVPSQGFSETSINYFSQIYTNQLISIYDVVKNRIVSMSIYTSILFYLIILTLDIYLYGFDIYRMTLLAVILGIASLNTYGEITETSLLVRLKNDSFMVAKVIYATILVSSIVCLTLVNQIGLVNIFICFFFAQIINSLYIGVKDYRIWHQTSK